MKGFIDMDSPTAVESLKGPLPLHVGVATNADTLTPLRMAWRSLADRSDLPTTQHEWTLAAMGLLRSDLRPMVMYVSDNSGIRAILPLMPKIEYGVEHFQFLSPSASLPMEVLHADSTSLEMVLRHVLKLGRPLVLNRLLEGSPTVEFFKVLGDQHKARTMIESAEPVQRLGVANFPQQDRAGNAARVSILAASFGLSGGPNDVIFQYASPSIDQVMSLYHESLQLEGYNPSLQSRKSTREIDGFEFLRAHAFHGAQRGELRFACLRLAGRLLAVQMFQLRRQTAWLLKATHLDRFRGTTLDTLLMGETMRKLQQEDIAQIIMPSGAAGPELSNCEAVPLVNLRCYPWCMRSLAVLSLARVCNTTNRLLHRTGNKPRG